MAFADPLVITVNGVAKNLVRVNSGNPYETEYQLRETTGSYRARLRHVTILDTKTRPGVSVNRHSLELLWTVFPVSPATIPTIRKTVVIMEESVNDDVLLAQDLGEAMVDFLTDANLLKLLNNES